YGHKVSLSYNTEPAERKSNRGRKKKEKTRKMRKYQGDGSSFNSQITFSVIGTHIRRTPVIPETAKPEIKVEKLGNGLESVTKAYKIKVFRNGSTTIPGILTEDMSDIAQPLREVCAYLGKMLLEDVRPISLYSVMQNYKCRLLEGQINIKKLQTYCEQHFHHLLNTRFSDIIDFLVNPAFEGDDVSPIFYVWNDVFAASVLDAPDCDVSYREMKRYLLDSMSSKNLYV